MARPSTNQLEVVPPGQTSSESAKSMQRAAEELKSTKPPTEVVGVEAPADTVKTTSPGDPSDFGRDAFAAFIQSQAAVARGLEALSAELAGLTRSGIDAAARAATDMLAVKTITDAIELNAGFSCSSIDALVRGSTKLSELGAKLVAEASQPILAQLGRGWGKPVPHAF